MVKPKGLAADFLNCLSNKLAAFWLVTLFRDQLIILNKNLFHRRYFLV